MLTIILAVIIAITAVCFLSATGLKMYDICIVFFGIIILGCLIAREPLYGYEEPITEEYNLTHLDEKGEVFVEHYLNDVYLFKAQTKNENGETIYRSDLIKGEVLENEDANCVNPVLKKRIAKPKKGIFTICSTEKITYEFHVPVDGIDEIKESIT